MKPQEIHPLEKLAAKAIEECLARVPSTMLEMCKKSDSRYDLSYRLVQKGRQRLIVIEVKNSGEPRIAREAVNHLARCREDCPDCFGVFVAPFISEQAAAICEQENVGYLDLAGNCRLSLDDIYIERRGFLNTLATKRRLRSLYSPKAERILRTLLLAPKRFWQVQELAKEADVSLGQTSNIKRLLEDREWLNKETGSERFRLSDPNSLLTEWSHQIHLDRSISRDYYSVSPIHEIESEVARYCSNEEIPYAFTGLSGAARYAQYVRYQQVSAYVIGNLQNLSRNLGLKSVESGANIKFFTPYDDGVFQGISEIDGISVVSPIQVYLDLQGTQGRGKEAAEFLREEVIESTWR